MAANTAQRPKRHVKGTRVASKLVPSNDLEQADSITCGDNRRGVERAG